ncbi:hypothetical protein VNI00_007670 [Paramarasmius palmivorus]|uniref:Uncharacterized protein n=1 Tax=Paramarasmius palmivorus TaxID=297713 RepID=A0AAW0D641_9AGAR
MAEVESEILKIENWESYQWPMSALDYNPKANTPVKDIKTLFANAVALKVYPFVASKVFEDAPIPSIELMVNSNSSAIQLKIPVENGQAQELRQSIRSESPCEITLHASKVVINDKEWDKWLTETVTASLQESLGITLATATFSCRLKFLSLFYSTDDKGRMFSLPTDEQEPHHYGSLAVILPSSEGHVGGEFTFQCERRSSRVISTEMPACSEGERRVSAFLSYRDTHVSTGTVSSGYATMLQYDILYTGNIASSIPRSPFETMEKARRQISCAFAMWRRVLDGQSVQVMSSNPPQGLVCILNEKYDRDQDDIFRVSSLRGSDRALIVHLGMMAKGDEFDLHLGEASYVEEGYPVTHGDCDFGVGTRISVLDMMYGRYDVAMDEDEDDHESGGLSDTESKLEMSLVDKTHFSISNVTTLNGVPLLIDWPDLDNLRNCEDGGCDYTRCTVGRDLQDHEAEKVLNPARNYHDGGWLTQTWRSKCVLITPKASPHVRFTLPKDVVDNACTTLDTSLSGEPTNEDLVALDTGLRGLRELWSVDLSSELSPHVDSVSRAIIRWKKRGHFLDLLRACGDCIIARMGVPCLVEGFKTFDWQSIGFFYLNAVNNEPSIRLRRELLGQLQALATQCKDTNIIAWCRSRFAEFVDKIQTVGTKSEEIDAVVLSLGNANEILDNLHDKLLPRLYEHQLSDIKMWTALFNRLRSESSMSQETVLGMIKQILKHISSNLRIFRKGDLEVDVEHASQVVADLVGLCIVYDVLDVVPPLLQDLWNESELAASTVRTGFCYAFIQMLGKHLIEHPSLKASLQHFFRGVFQHLLFEHTPERDTDLRSALGYLDNPVETLVHFLDAESMKALAAKDNHTLDAITRFVHLLRGEFDGHSESGAKLQIILQLSLEARLSTLDIIRFQTNSSIKKSPVPRFIRLCVDTENHSISARTLEMCLNASNKPDYVEYQLVPVLRSLSESLKQHEFALTASYPNFAGEVVKRYVRHVVGPAPLPSITPQDWKNIGCGCSDCNILASWIHNYRAGSKNSFRKSEESRQHLISQLEKLKSWGISWDVLGGNPKTGKVPLLKVHIPSHFKDMPTWFAKVEEAATLLRLLGDDREQKEVLGREYWSITATIAGHKRPLASNDDPESTKRPRLA